MSRKEKVVTLGDRFQFHNLNLSFPKESKILSPSQTTILILTTDKCLFCFGHISALVVPPLSSNFENTPVALVNFPSNQYDWEILRKFEKAIMELDNSKNIRRWENRLQVLHSEKSIDSGLILDFQRKFSRKGSGLNYSYNFWTNNCSDPVAYMLQHFFPKKMITPKPSRTESILGFFCTPCFFLTCAASCVPRPQHPKINNPSYILAKAKNLSSDLGEIKHSLEEEEEKENNCCTYTDACADCCGGMLCLFLSAACVLCYGLPCPFQPTAFGMQASHSLFNSAKKNFKKTISSSEEPLLPENQIMSDI